MHDTRSDMACEYFVQCCYIWSQFFHIGPRFMGLESILPRLCSCPPVFVNSDGRKASFTLASVIDGMVVSMVTSKIKS